MVETGSITLEKKPTWIGTGEVLPKNKGDFLLDFVLVLSNLSTGWENL